MLAPSWCDAAGDGPVSIRYPKCNVETIERPTQPVELGKAEVLDWGRDGMLIACGTLFSNCVKAAAELRKQGLDVGVINARFIKPLDETTLLRALREAAFVLTIEESTLVGGFGSAVLELANDHGVNTSHIRRLGVPDRFIEHGERNEQLADIGLDVAGIVKAAKEMARTNNVVTTEPRAFAG